MKHLLLLCFLPLLTSCIDPSIIIGPNTSCPDIIHSEQGIVKDYYTNEPIQSVRVFIEEGIPNEPRIYNSYTDAFGRYYVSGAVRNCFNSGGHSLLKITAPEGYNSRHTVGNTTYLLYKRKVEFEFIKTDTSQATRLWYKIESPTHNHTSKTWNLPLDESIHEIRFAVKDSLTFYFKTDLMEEFEAETIYVDPDPPSFGIKRYY